MKFMIMTNISTAAEMQLKGFLGLFNPAFLHSETCHREHVEINVSNDVNNLLLTADRCNQRKLLGNVVLNFLVFAKVRPVYQLEAVYYMLQQQIQYITSSVSLVKNTVGFNKQRKPLRIIYSTLSVDVTQKQTYKQWMKNKGPPVQ